MNFPADFSVEKYILETKWESLPEDVQTRARGCGVDLFTALILGSLGKQFAAGEKLAAQLYAGKGSAFSGYRRWPKQKLIAELLRHPDTQKLLYNQIQESHKSKKK